MDNCQDWNKHAGIDVLESDCAYLTRMGVIGVCGAGFTYINIHTIRSESLQDAENLDFQSVSELENEIDSGYTVIECESEV